jgi:hypothetical protein
MRERRTGKLKRDEKELGMRFAEGGGMKGQGL